ncbi:MAG: outer membrane protein assembly factor BamE [Gallionella sp.]|nr:outer membrane protein assembly factor BamE [Gallionella sp.]
MRAKLILCSVMLASCSDFSLLSMPFVSSSAPHKTDIRQNNYITPEMREKLKLGMTKPQVHHVLGEPMIGDAPQGNRWDYVYNFENRGEMAGKQRLALYFDGDNLARIDDGKAVEAAPAVAQQVAPVASEPIARVDPEPIVKTDPEMDVLKSVQDWAAAWSARNTRDYLAVYAAGFKPDGMGRDAWEKQRLDRIGKPSVIEVVLSDINVVMDDDKHATVSFTQDYRSDSYRDQVEKTLRLIEQSGHWLIIEERAGKVIRAKAKAQADEPPEASAQPINAGQQAVQDTVMRLAEAWSARDADKYLDGYGSAFKPAGMSKEAWEMQLREGIGKGCPIAVKVSELKIKLHDDSHASATFIQDCRSDSHKGSTRKTLLLEKIGNAWLIVAEQAAK